MQQPHLEHDILALQLLGARHQAELDAEAREQPQRHLLIAIAYAKGVRARIARPVLDVRLCCVERAAFTEADNRASATQSAGE